ncbi:hypothetical protein CALCODRAFT_484124 [Calocera cornea HHB12733]|uniref:DUF6532 domain-containing protein n=1 Tax=Calocera cornea HHB12733 TaxID=1353952 RepID=A0A165F586_9BASI|nr:hypothetical protein CALCODRAFT_484124 [Calocera cornea HHB12733]
MRNIIEQRDSQLRGKIKDCAARLVGQYYKLPVVGTRDDAEATAKEATRLLTGAKFIYVDTHDANPYENGCIEAVYCDMWFRDVRSEGVRFRKIFEKGPAGALALVVTAVR